MLASVDVLGDSRNGQQHTSLCDSNARVPTMLEHDGSRTDGNGQEGRQQCDTELHLEGRVYENVTSFQPLQTVKR